MRLSANFTLAEFTKSQTATRKGLDNTPGKEHLASAKALFENVVQKVRDNFGVTVINSGYRGPALNEAVGGSSKSQHCKGEAVDIECPGTGNYDVAKWISENCDFDQLILEFYTPGEPNSGWIHCSYTTDQPRKQFLHAYKSEGKTKYKPVIGKARDLV